VQVSHHLRVVDNQDFAVHGTLSLSMESHPFFMNEA
jgi:hypothetical protein